MQDAEIKEISENICLLSNRLTSLTKYICCIDKISAIDKTVIVNLILEISYNIKIEVQNLKYISK